MLNLSKDFINPARLNRKGMMTGKSDISKEYNKIFSNDKLKYFVNPTQKDKVSNQIKINGTLRTCKQAKSNMDVTQIFQDARTFNIN